MKKSNYYIITPNEKPDFRIDVEVFKKNLIEKWNSSFSNIIFGEKSTKNVLNFKIVNDSKERLLSASLGNDLVVLGIDSSDKISLFEFAMWVRNEYPKEKSIHIFNDLNLEEHLELTNDIEVNEFQKIFDQ